MRKLIVQQWITQDGFAAGPNGEIDWFTAPELAKYSDEYQLGVLKNVDTILLGANTYRMFVEFWPTPQSQSEVLAEYINTTPKFVLSNHLKSAPWGEYAPASILHGNAVDEVSKLKGEHGKDIVLWGSLTLTRAMFAANLVDEVHLRTCPIALGAGQAMFPATHRVPLKARTVIPYDSGVVLGEYLVQPGV